MVDAIARSLLCLSRLRIRDRNAPLRANPRDDRHNRGPRNQASKWSNLGSREIFEVEPGQPSIIESRLILGIQLNGLAEIVRGVLFMLGPSLSRQPHRVATRIPAGIIMESQPGALEQIIINLVNNAFLHAFEQRRDGVLNIVAEAAGGSVMLTISDNGVGMDEEIVGRIFQPFFSTKIGRGGTGLGMAIVDNLVKKLGGKISVQSKRGEGTRFTLRLPQTMPDNVGKSLAAMSDAPALA